MHPRTPGAGGSVTAWPKKISLNRRSAAGRWGGYPGPVRKYFAHWAMWFEVVMSWNGRQKAV